MMFSFVYFDGDDACHQLTPSYRIIKCQLAGDFRQAVGPEADGFFELAAG